MNHKFLGALAASLAMAVVPASVSAAPLLFTITGLQPNTYSASFTLDTAASPSITLPGQSVRYNGLTINYMLPGGSAVFTDNGPFDGAVFRTAGQESGGFNVTRLDQAGNFGNGIFLYGPQIFSGTTANPVFAPGSFDLSDIQPPFSTSPLQVNYRLVISDPTAAVPEPASWAMMIGGFGLVGATLRTRRRAVRITA